jgi:hypothetical protein
MYVVAEYSEPSFRSAGAKTPSPAEFYKHSVPPGLSDVRRKPSSEEQESANLVRKEELNRRLSQESCSIDFSRVKFRL